MHHAHGDGDRPCVFEDVCQISRGVRCVVHDRRCDLAKVHLLVAGWSCKDLSRLNVNFARKANQNVLQECRGTSGKTLQGLLEVLYMEGPRIYIAENVDDLADIGSENRAYFMSALRSVGYEAEIIKLTADRYGHWTQRPRGYIIALRLESFGISAPRAKQILHQMMNTVTALQLPAAKASMFCLSADDPYVVADLERQVGNKQRSQEAALSAETSWQGPLLALCHARGIRWSQCKPTDDQDNEFFAALPDRVQKVISYNMLIHPDASSVDGSQNCDRAFIGHDDKLTTLTPSSRPWVKEIARCITGKECMLVQGFPRRFFDSAGEAIERAGISDCAMRSMAGNSFCSNCFGAILIAVLLHLPAGSLELEAGSTSAADAVDEDQEVLDILGLGTS